MKVYACLLLVNLCLSVATVTAQQAMTLEQLTAIVQQLLLPRLLGTTLPPVPVAETEPTTTPVPTTTTSATPSTSTLAPTTTQKPSFMKVFNNIMQSESTMIQAINEQRSSLMNEAMTLGLAVSRMRAKADMLSGFAQWSVDSKLKQLEAKEEKVIDAMETLQDMSKEIREFFMELKESANELTMLLNGL